MIDEHHSHLRIIIKRLRFTPWFWALFLSPLVRCFLLHTHTLFLPSSIFPLPPFFNLHTSQSIYQKRKQKRVDAVVVVVKDYNIYNTLVNQHQQKKNKMMLGKRPRPPMKRTTSMSEITFDLNTATDVDPNNPMNRSKGPGEVVVGGLNGLDQSQNKVLATVSPINHRRHSSDLPHTHDFLRSCSLCKRRLVPGRDIYMYKGDSAFCSLECRQQQMNQDERKDKCCVASKKQVVAQPSGSKVPTKGETAVAL